MAADSGKRKRLRRRILAIAASVGALQVGGLLWGTAAHAASPCDMLFGPMRTACLNTQHMVSGTTGGTSPVAAATDPLGTLAKATANAAKWIINHLASEVNNNAQVDFTNSGFLKQYAIVFAAATFLTVVLWLLAVVKRAVRGEPIARALGEATGFLWLAVLASAFTPVILAGMVKVTDSITSGIASGTNQDSNKFLAGYANSLDPNKLGGGPVMLIFVSLLSIIAATILWLELLIRAAMLYVGAALAAPVFAGLVDRELWHNIRRWAGLMVAVDLTKVVIVVVLGLATAVSNNGGPTDAFGAVLSGLAIMLVSIFASGMIYRFVPSFGDEIIAASASRGDAGADAAGAMVGPAGRMQQGIATHANRGESRSAPAGPAIASAARSATLAVASGVATHGGRAARAALTTQPTPELPQSASAMPPRPPSDSA